MISPSTSQENNESLNELLSTYFLKQAMTSGNE